MPDALKIAGIEVPSKSPLFLTLLAFHVLAALVCVVTGIAAMLSEKRPGRHPVFGTTYYWSSAVTFAANRPRGHKVGGRLSAVYSRSDFVQRSIFGRTARRRLWRTWVNVHIPAMGFSYIVMLTAFYVDNGKSLPVWRKLPHFTYWLLPTLVGIPLIVRALARYSQRQDAVHAFEK